MRTATRFAVAPPCIAHTRVWFTGGCNHTMKLIDSAIGSVVPRLGIGARWLREQLAALGVTVPLSNGCIEEFVRNANDAVARTRTPGEPYMSCLRRQIEARARFIQLWTTTDEKFERAEWGELVEIAQRFALPRPWKLAPDPVPSVPKRNIADEIPEHLVVKILEP